MAPSRRAFVTASAAAAALSTIETVAFAQSGQGGRRVRAALLREPGFPLVDGGQDLLPSDPALAGLDVTVLGAAELEQLDERAHDLLILPYGSAFPAAAFPAIAAFLAAGRDLLVLGGVPFAVPVTRDGAAWRAGTRQTNHHKRLGLTHAFAVEAPPGAQVDAAPLGGAALRAGFTPPRVWAGYWRFTRVKAVPGEDGSDGEREAVIAPLVTLAAANGTFLAAPVVEVDRLQGPFAGGRWVLAMVEGPIPPALLRALVLRAAAGQRRLAVRTDWACYREGEAVEVGVQRSGERGAGSGELGAGSREQGARRRVSVEIADERGRRVAAVEMALPDGGAVRSATSTLRGVRLAPGFYRVRAVQGDLTAENGFWVRDEALLARGEPFGADAYTLTRSGRPFPVTGTTYMAGDVHRRFLFEPNPAVWDRDMAAMKAAGCTMLRTGIWTGFLRYAPRAGAVDEGVLRAFEAWVLTAQRHDLPVIFNFFAFIPEAWGGQNAYLDPDAVRAQVAFITAFARRVQGCPSVIWDLINEPSFCNPQRLWSCRPNHDAHEQRAWAAWLRETYPAADEAAFRLQLADRWRMAAAEPLDLPPESEFGDRNLWEQARPLRTTSYRLFAQAMFARWARQLAEALRAVDPRQLVTVGQDEGGTGESPGNHLFADAMDLTSIHTWWLNDDLVWDHVVTKVPGKPNLAQETGIMFVETLGGESWRTEELARDLLERKLALALGVGAAGYIEWIWNINTTMPLDNESTIGLHRPDGSAKPEFAVWRGLNAFGAELRGVGPREREPVLLVLPHANLWSSRNQATDATKRAVRALAYHCRVPVAGVSEFTLARLGYAPRLVIVPAPRVLSEPAWQALLGLANAGATVLVTGPFDADEYWRPAGRLARLGVDATLRPVAPAEDLRISETPWRLSFRGDRMTRVETATVPAQAIHDAVRIAQGRGQLFWVPVPVELAHEVEPTAALYRRMLAWAEIAPPVVVEPDDPGVLVWASPYRDATLLTVVSELARERTLRITERTSGATFEVTVGAGRVAMVLVRRDGRVVARYG